MTMSETDQEVSFYEDLEVLEYQMKEDLGKFDCLDEFLEVLES